MKTYKGDLNKETIPENGIFVFGSNTVSINGNPYRGTGGAALVAHLEFGIRQDEKMINCFSENRKTYGLVTVMAPRVYITNATLINNIKKLYECAASNQDLLFYVAYSGINPESKTLNGRKIKNLAKLFYVAGTIPDNIIFEYNFSKLLK
jgi:hypothetical protein